MRSTLKYKSFGTLFLTQLFFWGTITVSTAQNYRKLGNKALDKGKFNEALNYYYKVAEKHADDPQAHYDIAYCMARLGNHIGCIETSTRAIDMDSTDWRLYFVRGLCKGKIEDYRAALADYNTSITLKPDPDTYNNRASTKYLMDDYEGALADYNRAIEMDPAFFEAYFGRGSSKVELKDHEGALEDYTKAIELNPSDPDSYFERGLVRNKIKDVKGAVEDYTKAIEFNFDGSEAYYNRGISKQDLNDNEGAIVDFTKAIELNPKDANSYYNRAYSKSDLKDYAGAIDDYTKFIQLDSTDADAYSNRAFDYNRLKLRRAAIADYLKALQLRSDISDLLSISEIYLITGKYQEAFDYASQANKVFDNTANEAISLFFICASGRLLKLEVKNTEKRLIEVLTKEFSPAWSFTEVEEEFARHPMISADDKEFISKTIKTFDDKTQRSKLKSSE